VRNWFLPRDAYATQMNSAVYGMARCPPVCRSQVGVLSKRIKGSRCFYHGYFPRRILLCVIMKFRYLWKQRFFPLEPFPDIWTQPIFLLYRRGTSTVAGVVNKVQPSLFMTFISLLHVRRSWLGTLPALPSTTVEPLLLARRHVL